MRFRTECGIFLLHVGSFVICVGIAAVLGYRLGTPLAGLVLAVGLHGLYSLSFLEAWSLTDGSYSFQLLNLIGQSGRPVAAGDLAGAQAIGTQKQQDRADTLRRLGLVGANDRLTFAGRLAAFALRAVLWLSNGKPMN